MNENVIVVSLDKPEEYVLHQNDSGQIIQFVEEIKDSTHAIFSTSRSPKGARQYILNNQVEIPNDLLKNIGTLRVDVLIITSNSETTVKTVYITIKRRPEASDEVAQENQQTFIQQVQGIMTATKSAAESAESKLHTNEAVLEQIDEKSNAAVEKINNTANARLKTISDAAGNLLKKTGGKNLLNIDATISGYIQNSSGTIVIRESTVYKTSDFIPIKAGQSVVISPSMRTFVAFDSEKNYIAGTATNTETSNYVFTATQDGYIRFSYRVANEAITQIEYGTEPTEYEPYSEIKIEENVGLSDYQKEQVSEIAKKNNTSNVDYTIGNILYGKKWAVCGDSFSNGDFTNAVDEDYTISDGKYAGQNKVYGYLIANRNNMEIQHLAKGGRTMAMPADGSFTNCFVNEIYKNIDADVDYITLYFGINDSHHRDKSTESDGEDQTGVIELGMINDTDTNTFYGAWNTVMAYLIENYPNAHIGIIASNGCETADYPNAEITIAQKWGVPYIDLNGDDRTPMMIRSTNSNITPSAKTMRNQAFTVNYGVNNHPSAAAHEYQSTFIENWLRGL